MSAALSSPPADRVARLLDAPPLSKNATIAKYEAWRAGLHVPSIVAAIGELTLTEDERLLVYGANIARERYTLLSDHSYSASRLEKLHRAFTTLVYADMDRSGLKNGKLRLRTFAGNYGPESQEPWHSDNHQEPSVRYIAAFGDVGSTRFAIGRVSTDDIEVDTINGGDLLPHIIVGPGGQLEETDTYPTGTILRFMNIADIHSGPSGSGARLLLQATVTF